MYSSLMPDVKFGQDLTVPFYTIAVSWRVHILSCVMFACLEECRSNCEAGDYCGNKRLQRKQWKQMEDGIMISQPSNHQRAVTSK